MAGLLLGALLLAGLFGCSGEARITAEFEKIADERCEKLLDVCMRQGRLRCVCEHDMRETDDPSVPYEGSVTLLSTTGRLRLNKKPRGLPGRNKMIRKHKDVFNYRYSGGRWEEAVPAGAQ
jgi:hypothetical protein